MRALAPTTADGRNDPTPPGVPAWQPKLRCLSSKTWPCTTHPGHVARSNCRDSTVAAAMHYMAGVEFMPHKGASQKAARPRQHAAALAQPALRSADVAARSAAPPPQARRRPAAQLQCSAGAQGRGCSAPGDSDLLGVASGPAPRRIQPCAVAEPAAQPTNPHELAERHSLMLDAVAGSWCACLGQLAVLRATTPAAAAAAPALKRRERPEGAGHRVSTAGKHSAGAGPRARRTPPVCAAQQNKG